MTRLSEVPERMGYKDPFSLVHGPDLEYPVPGYVPVVKRIHIREVQLKLSECSHPLEIKQGPYYSQTLP